MPPNAHRPLKRVVVPTDFSRGAELAFRRALLLPLATNATISIVHVLPAKLPAKLLRAATSDAKRALAALVERGREAVSDRVTVTSELLTGKPFEAIILATRRLRSELIVIGRHGHRPIRDMFIGSTAERVVRKGGRPVLIVHLEPKRPYRRPLIATDLEATSARTFDLALRVMGPDVASVHVTHACHIPFEGLSTPAASQRAHSSYRQSFVDEATAGVEALLEKYGGPKWKALVRVGDPRSVILTDVVQRRSDLLTVGTRGRSGIVKALLGSVAAWVVSAAACDVLVAPPDKDA